MQQLVDFEGLETTFNGKPQILKQLIGEYSQRAPELSQAVAGAVQEGDMGLAEEKAHALKGNSGLIGAHRVQEIAAQLCDAARQGDIQGAKQSLPLLESAVSETVKSLSSYLA